MQPEPNNKMDELLKRLARERREKSGSDFELHPATRQILQNEVARTFPPSKSKAKPLFVFWPRLALMGVFTALLALTLVVLNTPRTSNRGFELSQRSDQPASPVPEQPQTAAKEKSLANKSTEVDDFTKKQIPPADTTLLFKRENSPQTRSALDGVQVANGGRAEEKLFAPRGQVAPAENRSDQFADRKQASESAKVETAATGPAIAARSLQPAPVPAAAPAQYYADTSSLARRRFVQQDLRAKFRQNLLSPPPSKVLQSFEVARVGNKIQLFDEDGSVYEGEIFVPVGFSVGKKDSQDKAQEPSRFSFRAAGTNQQLHRLVTINGSFALTNANLVSNEKTKAKIADALNVGRLKEESGLSGKANGSINGKISIGGTNEFEIQAIELPR